MDSGGQEPGGFSSTQTATVVSNMISFVPQWSSKKLGILTYKNNVFQAAPICFIIFAGVLRLERAKVLMFSVFHDGIMVLFNFYLS